MIRKDWNDQIFRTETEKNKAIVSKISECNKTGQPVLVFTSSINKSEQYSKLLRAKGITHTILNAKNEIPRAPIIEEKEIALKSEKKKEESKKEKENKKSDLN